MYLVFGSVTLQGWKEAEYEQVKDSPRRDNRSPPPDLPFSSRTVRADRTAMPCLQEWGSVRELLRSLCSICKNFCCYFLCSITNSTFLWTILNTKNESYNDNAEIFSVIFLSPRPRDIMEKNLNSHLIKFFSYYCQKTINNKLIGAIRLRWKWVFSIKSNKLPVTTTKSFEST